MSRIFLFALGLAILAVLLPSQASAGLVTNGGFETGNFSGWAVSGTMVYYGVSHGSAHSGSWGAWFGDVSGLTYISQSIPTTPGQNYLLTYYIANSLPPGEVPDSYGEVRWNGNLVVSGADAPAFSYKMDSFLLAATGNSAELAFGFMNPPGAWRLDDIDVNEVPEPATGPVFLVAVCCLFAVSRLKYLPSR